mgnify:CR=1 FL=1
MEKTINTEVMDEIRKNDLQEVMDEIRKNDLQET